VARNTSFIVASCGWGVRWLVYQRYNTSYHRDGRGIRWRYWAEGECFSETPRFKLSNDEAARWNTASGGFVLFLRSSIGCGTFPTVWGVIHVRVDE